MFWSGMTELKRIRVTLDPRPLSLVLYHRNLKSTVGKYIGRVPGPERGRNGGQPKEVRSLS